MADYAALLNAEKKKTSQPPPKVAEQVIPPASVQKDKAVSNEKILPSQDTMTAKGQDSSSPSNQEIKHTSIQGVKDTRVQDLKHTSTQGYMDASIQVPKHTRPTKTHTYELFIDQVKAVKRLALEEELNGRDGNQSKIVREALDEYLKKKRLK